MRAAYKIDKYVMMVIVGKKNERESVEDAQRSG